MKDLEARYLERLSQLYPTIAKASTEIINLQAILNLPKVRNIFLRISMGNMKHFPMFLRMDREQFVEKLTKSSEIL